MINFQKSKVNFLNNIKGNLWLTVKKLQFNQPFEIYKKTSIKFNKS